MSKEVTHYLQRTGLLLKIFKEANLSLKPCNSETTHTNYYIGGWMGPGAGLDAVAKVKFPAPARN